MKNAAQYGFSNGFVVYNEQDIEWREYMIRRVYQLMRDTLQDVNKSITFERAETPMLLKPDLLRSHIEENFELIRAGKYYLRPETTKGLYLCLEGKKLPYCVWQVGKSYRDEKFGKFRFDNLRFREFYQQEFELAYNEGTKADYMECVQEAFCKEFGMFARIPHDLPHYSEKTIDLYLNDHEVVAISKRKDYKTPILEVSVGLDRLCYLTK